MRAEALAVVATVVSVGALLPTPSVAQDTGARFTISGTSTVRGWSCPGQGTVRVTPGTSAKPVPGFPSGVQSVTITVPIKSINCPEEEMTEHLRETFKKKAESEIVYQLERYELTGANMAKATGRITIDGVTKPIELEISLAESPQGLRGSGETQIDMTQFAMKPPTLWAGLLKVGNMVRVKFDAVLPAAQ